MTIPLYYEYPLVTECSAKVLDCIERDNKYLIQLDRTPLFPAGGGQLSDRGFIDDVEVTDVQNENGTTLHYCAAPIPSGKRVTVRLDISTRLDHSEQHTGEHILSGLSAKLFSAVNVGFHMAENYCTIDLNVFLSEEQLALLELEANAAVRANLPIHTEVVDEAEALQRMLRKRSEKIKGDVRIVYIDNGKLDSCTCCGTHIAATGMVGSIKITNSQKYKGGTRLWFNCGNRSAKAAILLQNELTTLARLYSTSREELPELIAKQQNELAALKLAFKNRSELFARCLAERITAGIEPINGILPVVAMLGSDSDTDDLRLICDAVCEQNNAIALLFVQDHDGFCYRMTRSCGIEQDMRELCAIVNAEVNGKGGGSGSFAQGRTAHEVSKIALESLRCRIVEALSIQHNMVKAET